MKKYYKKAFTLVEILVVITIITLLSTIWFISFSSKLEKADETKLFSDAKDIKNSLEIILQKDSRLPLPLENNTIKDWSKILSFQGKINKAMLENTWIDKDFWDDFMYRTWFWRNSFSIWYEGLDDEKVSIKTLWNNLWFIYENSAKLERDLDLNAWSLDISNIKLVFWENKSEIITWNDIFTFLKPRNWIWTSCRDLIDSDSSLSWQNGIYFIKNQDSFLKVYCDMTSGWWWWTMILAQYENSFSNNWNAWINSSYMPDLSTTTGFIMDKNEIPNHTQIWFWRDLDADFVDYVNWVYTTWNIEKKTLISPKTGYSYHIYRNTANYYNNLDPETNVLFSWASYINSLVVNKVWNNLYSWIFSPNHSLPESKWTGMNWTSFWNDSFAWTIWVR